MGRLGFIVGMRRGLKILGRDGDCVCIVGYEDVMTMYILFV